MIIYVLNTENIDNPVVFLNFLSVYLVLFKIYIIILKRKINRKMKYYEIDYDSYQKRFSESKSKWINKESYISFNTWVNWITF